MGKQRRWYRITLDEPLILSQRNVTSGEHRTLDFIPGRVLLGVTARIYESLGERAWTAFHSGAVRFIDAVPETTAGRRALPTPRCLQRVKREKLTEAYNHAVEQSAVIDDSLQYTSLGTPYVDIDDAALTTIGVEKTSTVKTAVDSSGGPTPKEGHLFSYQAISRDQQFLARLDADTDVEPSTLDALEDALVGAQRIGRSRTAEFGAVTIERVSDPETPATSAATVGDTQLRVVLTSELALVDERTGAARLTPRPGDFGLPDHWKLEPSHSFVRRRHYDRFNGYRRSFDLKRHVLRRGSVITFTSGSDDRRLTADELAEAERRASTGAGVDRHEGLGQFLLEPAWIGRETLSVDAADDEDAGADESIQPPDPALKAFVQRRVGPLSSQQREQLYRDAEKLARFCADNRDAPEKSQWSRLRRWAKAAPITQNAFARLAGAATSDDGKPKLSKGWEVTFEGQPLGEYVVNYGQAEDGDGSHLLCELAHLVRANLVHHRKTGHQQEASR